MKKYQNLKTYTFRILFHFYTINLILIQVTSNLNYQNLNTKLFNFLYHKMLIHNLTLLFFQMFYYKICFQVLNYYDKFFL